MRAVEIIKIGQLLLALILASCASRGRPLGEQYPEWFSSFKKEDFVLKEDEKNIVYYSKDLLHEIEAPENFNLDDYEFVEDDGRGYPVYYPKASNDEFLGLYKNKNGDWIESSVITKKSYLIKRD
jgi:hypothetical protein